MTTTPDKSKLRELIQKSAAKDLLYLHINPVEPKSLENALKELHKFVGKGGAEVVLIKYQSEQEKKTLPNTIIGCAVQDHTCCHNRMNLEIKDRNTNDTICTLGKWSSHLHWKDF